MKLQSLQSVDGKTRDEVVPYYFNLLLVTDSRITEQEWTPEQCDIEIRRVNNLILSKWTSSGLLYIKNKAWRMFESINSSDDLDKAVLKA